MARLKHPLPPAAAHTSSSADRSCCVISDINTHHRFSDRVKRDVQPFFLKQRPRRLCVIRPSTAGFLLLALLEIVNIFNLSNKIERLIVFMTNQRDGQ